VKFLFGDSEFSINRFGMKKVEDDCMGLSLVVGLQGILILLVPKKVCDFILFV
jgi:hypothetical protein